MLHLCLYHIENSIFHDKSEKEAIWEQLSLSVAKNQKNAIQKLWLLATIRTLICNPSSFNGCELIFRFVCLQNANIIHPLSIRFDKSTLVNCVRWYCWPRCYCASFFWLVPTERENMFQFGCDFHTSENLVSQATCEVGMVFQNLGVYDIFPRFSARFSLFFVWLFIIHRVWRENALQLYFVSFQSLGAEKRCFRLDTKWLTFWAHFEKKKKITCSALVRKVQHYLFTARSS